MDAENAEVRRASVGWVERSDTHHAFVAMGIGLDGLNPSYALMSEGNGTTLSHRVCRALLVAARSARHPRSVWWIPLRFIHPTICR